MSKKGKRNCDSFLSKKERKELGKLISNVDWCDEDSVWDCGVALREWSVKLRAEILRRNSDDYYEE